MFRKLSDAPPKLDQSLMDLRRSIQHYI